MSLFARKNQESSGPAAATEKANTIDEIVSSEVISGQSISRESVSTDLVSEAQTPGLTKGLTQVQAKLSALNETGESGAASVLTPASGSVQKPRTMPIKLLIIDDDVDQRALTAEVLEDHFGQGSVSHAGTGREAMEQPLADFDLIISDYNLPDCTGLELLGRIQQKCKTPVIMVTGENVTEIAAEAIRRGATDYVVKMGEYFFTLPLVVEKNLTVIKLMRENESLRTDLEGALSAVQQTNQQLELSLRRVEEMAATDPLTGLYNRRHFSRVLEQMYDEANRYGNDLACLMIDLDGYKQLNDSLGHQVGDQILVLVGRILKDSMRKADVAARYGGDEFVLLLPQCDSNEAQQLGGRIREAYREQTRLMLNRDNGMSMSIGVASVSSNQPASGDELITRSDAALYVSKEKGRDRITLSGDGKRLAAAS